MDCAGGCAKFLLIVFNFIFWLSGAAILGVGAWMIADKDIASYFDVLSVDTEAQYFKYAAYILIAFGVFVLLVGFCGCCGAIRNSVCLLSLYIFFLVIIFCGELAVGILMVINKQKIEEKVDDTLKKSIKEEYGMSVDITDAWNIVQVQLECCGGLGPDDYIDSNFANKSESKSQNMSIPVTCCVLSNRDEAREDPRKAKPKNDQACYQKVSDFYTKGCKDGLLTWAGKHTGILIGVGFGIAFLQIFGCIAAFCLCRKVRNEDKY